MTAGQSRPWTAQRAVIGQLRQDDLTSSFDDMELLEVCRLPGELVGMKLSVDRQSTIGRTSVNEPRRVHVVSVTPGSPADRAFPSSASYTSLGETGGAAGGLRRGDEIVEINGKNLRLVASIDEVMNLIDEMPLRLLLLVKRNDALNDGKKSDSDFPHRPSDGATGVENGFNKTSSRKGELRELRHFSDYDRLRQQQQQQQEHPEQSPRGDIDLPSNFTRQTCTQSFEHEGFERRRLEFRKAATERLGLRLDLISIGFHTYYQIREILEGSLFSRRRLLRVGDCLLSFNGTPLEGLDKVECGRILTQNVVDVELEVLREKPGRSTLAATMTTQVDDVPTSPPVSGRLRQPQQPGPIVAVNTDQTNGGNESWFKTSFDDIVVTDVDDVIVHPSIADETLREPSEFFAHAHNTLHLSYGGYAASSDAERSIREDLVDGGRNVLLERTDYLEDIATSGRWRAQSREPLRNTSVGIIDRPIENATENANGRSVENGRAVAPIELVGKYDPSSFSSDVKDESSSIQNKGIRSAEPIDDRLLELTHRLATAAAAASSFASLSPAAPRSRKFQINDSRRSSSSPPPLPASSPPRATVAESTAKLDVFDDRSTLEDVEDHVTEKSTETEQTSSKRMDVSCNAATDPRHRRQSGWEFESGIFHRDSTGSLDVDAENTRNVRKPDVETRIFVGQTFVKEQSSSNFTEIDDSMVESMTSPSLTIDKFSRAGVLSSDFAVAALNSATFEDMGQKLAFSSDFRHTTSDFKSVLRQKDSRVESAPPSACVLPFTDIKRSQCDSPEGSTQSTKTIRKLADEDEDWNYRSKDVSKDEKLVDAISHSAATTSSEESDSDVDRQLRQSAWTRRRRPEPFGLSWPAPAAAVVVPADELRERRPMTASAQNDLRRETTDRSVKSIDDLSSARGGSLVAMQALSGSTTRFVLNDRGAGQQHHCVSASDCHGTNETDAHGKPVVDSDDWSNRSSVAGTSPGPIPLGSSRSFSTARALATVEKKSVSGRIGSTIVHTGPRWSDERRGNWNSSARESHNGAESESPSVQTGAGSKRRFKRLKLHSSIITIKEDSALLTSTLTPIAYGPFQLPRQRPSSGLFQVNVLRSFDYRDCNVNGIFHGLGIELKSVPEGVFVSEVTTSGPIGRDGNIRVGDYLLAVNGIDLLKLKYPDELADMFKHVPQGLVELVVYVGSPSSLNASTTHDLKWPLSTHDSHRRQRIDTARSPPSLGNGPVTQVLGVNSAQMKIVCRTTCEPSHQASVELLQEDRSLLDDAAAWMLLSSPRLRQPRVTN